MADMIVGGVTGQTPVRIYFEDTDVGGIVYYANYLRYAERARSELLREVGVESSDLMAEHRLALAVRRCLVNYLKPAKLDDLLMVDTAVVRVGGASIELRQRIYRNDEMLVDMEIKLAGLDLDTGRPRALPQILRTCLMKN